MKVPEGVRLAVSDPTASKRALICLTGERVCPRYGMVRLTFRWRGVGDDLDVMLRWCLGRSRVIEDCRAGMLEMGMLYRLDSSRKLSGVSIVDTDATKSSR